MDLLKLRELTDRDAQLQQECQVWWDECIVPILDDIESKEDYDILWHIIFKAIADDQGQIRGLPSTIGWLKAFEGQRFNNPETLTVTTND